MAELRIPHEVDVDVAFTYAWPVEDADKETWKLAIERALDDLGARRVTVSVEVKS